MTSYEALRDLVESLPSSDAVNQRCVEWCTPRENLGVAKSPNGQWELFLRGRDVRPQSALIVRHAETGEWVRQAGPSFWATRLVFPAAPHYSHVVAFLCWELLLAGADDKLGAAFRESEPVIEMALRGVALEEEATAGLFGELFFLEAMLATVETPRTRAQVLESWRGPLGGSRDFLFEDGVAVEVKVTRGATSRHPISSLRQIDPRRDPSGQPVEQLFLLSLGLEMRGPRDPEGRTLPELVEGVLGLLDPDAGNSRSPLQELFLTRLRSYTEGVSRPYDHDSDRELGAYALSWTVVFHRPYDMNDDAVSVLRPRDLLRYQHVVESSPRYTVDLPDVLTAGSNPVQDFTRFVERLVE